MSRLIKYGKQVFHAARRAGLIDRSPFDELKAGTMANPDRMHFVTAADTEAIISACPTSEWRLIVALARYGGLRCPSELLALRWEDVDWERNRFLVRSPKTAHHADGGRRWVPLFPEVRPHLEAAFDTAPEGQVNVVERLRSHETNLRTAFERIVYKAGLLPWPKPFQNMRASRETELMREHPMHVVTAWIGNTAPIAAKHYLQVTDDDYKRATGMQSAARALQIPVQSVAETGGMERNPTREKPHISSIADKTSVQKIRPTGVEADSATGISDNNLRQSADLSAANPGAVRDDSGILALLVALIEKLAPEQREALSGMLIAKLP